MVSGESAVAVDAFTTHYAPQHRRLTMRLRQHTV